MTEKDTELKNDLNPDDEGTAPSNSKAKKSSSPKRSGLSRLMIFLLFILAFFVLLALIFFGDSLFSRNGQTDEAEATPVAESEAKPTPVPTDTVKPTAEPTSEPLCGDVAQMSFLVIGADTAINEDDTLNNWEGYGEADFIGVVLVDFATPAIRILKIPQHLWIPIEGLTDEQIGQMHAYFGLPVMPDGTIYDPDGNYGRLNAAYFYSEYNDLPAGGEGVLTETLSNAFGLDFDSFIAVDPTVTVKMIDAVDGIAITVPQAIGDFEAGTQHMTGAQALDYSRILQQEDESWLQSERQHDVLLALMEKLQEPLRFIAIPTIIDIFLNDIETDLSTEQIANLYCLVDNVEKGDIQLFSITPEMVTAVNTTEDIFVMIPDTEQIEAVIAEYLGG